MVSRALPVVTALALLFACGGARSGIHVTIDGPGLPGRDFDLLEVLLARESGEPLPGNRYSGDDLPTTLPFSINFVSDGVLPAGTSVVVEAKASLTDSLRWTAQGTGALEGGQGGAL